MKPTIHHYLQEPLTIGKMVWILHPKWDGRVVAMDRTRGHYKTLSGVNKNGKQR